MIWERSFSSVTLFFNHLLFSFFDTIAGAAWNPFGWGCLAAFFLDCWSNEEEKKEKKKGFRSTCVVVFFCYVFVYLY